MSFTLLKERGRSSILFLPVCAAETAKATCPFARREACVVGGKARACAAAAAAAAFASMSGAPPRAVAGCAAEAAAMDLSAFCWFTIDCRAAAF